MRLDELRRNPLLQARVLRWEFGRLTRTRCTIDPDDVPRSRSAGSARYAAQSERLYPRMRGRGEGGWNLPQLGKQPGRKHAWESQQQHSLAIRGVVLPPSGEQTKLCFEGSSQCIDWATPMCVQGSLGISGHGVRH